MNRKIKTALITAASILFLWTIVVTSILISSGTDTTISVVLARSVPIKNPIITLPSGFSSVPETFEGNEIQYHLNIVGANDTIHGYFQIIFMGTDLEEYLETAERYRAADIDTFKKYNGDRPGSIIWEYTTPKSNVLSFFIKKEQYLYVLTLSADKDTVTMDKLKEYFNETLSGLVI